MPNSHPQSPEFVEDETDLAVPSSTWRTNRRDGQTDVGRTQALDIHDRLQVERESRGML